MTLQISDILSVLTTFVRPHTAGHERLAKDWQKDEQAITNLSRRSQVIFKHVQLTGEMMTCMNR